MSHAAKILADSISPDGVRLTTFEVTFPRIVLAEFNTHRMFSRNSASSRAIPVKKMLKMVMENPYVPSSWGKNQKGMQAGEEVDEEQRKEAEYTWLQGRDDAVDTVKHLLEVGIHKQLTNRLLEPWMWHTVIVTATEWSNFFHLRNNEMAHPDIQIPARLMQELYESNDPREVYYGEWHRPLIDRETESEVLEMCGAVVKGEQVGPFNVVKGKDLFKGDLGKASDLLVKISCARCARVSYLTHDGKRDLQKDLELYDNLLQPGHMSPFEHAARPMTKDEFWDHLPWMSKKHLPYEDTWPPDLKSFCGNFNGWIQHRKEIPGEYDILAHRREQ